MTGARDPRNGLQRRYTMEEILELHGGKAKIQPLNYDALAMLRNPLYVKFAEELKDRNSEMNKASWPNRPRMPRSGRWQAITICRTPRCKKYCNEHQQTVKVMTISLVATMTSGVMAAAAVAVMAAMAVVEGVLHRESTTNRRMMKRGRTL